MLTRVTRVNAESSPAQRCPHPTSAIGAVILPFAAGLVAVILVALLPVAATSPTHAATPHHSTALAQHTAKQASTSISIRVSRSGVTGIKVTWSKVARAKSYTITVAKDVKLKHRVKVTKRSAKKKRSVTVKLPTALRPGQRTPVSVRVTTTAKHHPYRSRIVTYTPKISVGRGSLTSVKRSGTSRIVVKFRKIAHATHYTIELASNQWFTINHSSVKRSTAHLTTSVTLPSRLRAGKGRTTFVRISASRYRTAGKASVSKWIRMTVPTGQGPTVNIASYNVCNECMYPTRTSRKDPAQRTAGDLDWAARRASIAAAVLRAKPDVIGLQELTTSDYSDGVTVTDRFQDLRTAINDKASSANYAYAYGDGDVTQSVASPDDSGSRNAQLMYNTQTVGLLDGGILAPRSLPGGNTGVMAYEAQLGNATSSPNYINNKWFSWGKFVLKSSGKQFFAVSVHLPELKDAKTELVRQQQMQVIVNFLQRLDPQHLPILVTGDLNSRDEFSTSGAHTVMGNNGYTDAWNSPSAAGLYYSTYGGFTTAADGAKKLVTTPKTYAIPAPRIDYIFGKYISGVPTYATQVVRTPAGKFDSTYHGSDHNLVKAQIRLG